MIIRTTSDSNMIVYNITTKILPRIKEQWLQWQTSEHIPEIMATGLFDAYKLYRLLEQDESEGLTFTIQFFTSSWQRYQQYTNTCSAFMQKKAAGKWGDQCIAFRTVMQLVN
ncbi:DUF4286 family protein [Agriterribacter sp.]|uniref:DUF4286 family protein n=1 Tax=Agriterribacter sp. TaxID=2821509 RepID=UPI002C73C784|nr:DUF4286 family protein [Agriterribacter sp.]HRP57185.1 DUF4286 family protein [Agriterribacter sp.]